MARVRVSTTVDRELLADARCVRAGSPDSELLDEALNALLARHRSAETDAAYSAYDHQPLDQPDEWGDLAAFPQGCRRELMTMPMRGELWWCEPPEIGRRPVVVLSRDVAIPRLRRALIAPCTTTIRGLPSEVVLEPGGDPVERRSAVNLDSIESVSVAVLVERLGRLSDVRMRQICATLAVAVDC